MRYIIHVIFFFLPFILFSQNKKLSKRTLAVVKKIESVNILMGSATGYSGTEPEQYRNYLNLCDTATLEELKTLTDYSNTVVRCYAFWGLCDKKNKEVFEITKKHIQDEELVETQFGCSGADKKVGDIFIASVTYDDYKDGRILDSLQVAELNKLVLSVNNSLRYKSEAVSQLPVTPGNYILIKKLAVKEKIDTAIIKLAEYKKEEDAEIILRLYNSNNPESSWTFYQAAANFPHPVFFQALKYDFLNSLSEKWQNPYWEYLDKAITAYQNTDAANLLSLLFTMDSNDAKSYHLNYLNNALDSYHCSVYDNLLWRLWQDKNISIENYRYLFTVNPQRMYAETRSYFDITTSFQNNNPDYSINKFVETEMPDELMIRIIRQNEKDVADNILIRELYDRKKLYSGTCLYLIGEYKEKAYIEPLFSQLEKNNRNILQIVEILLSYNDEIINSRIVNARKKYSESNDEWNYTEMKQLFSAHNIPY